MKRWLFMLVHICMSQAISAQYVYTIKADSVKITNTCDRAELIIENHIQTVPGFLFNNGRGRTALKRINSDMELLKQQLNELRTLILNKDTLGNK